VGPSSAFLGSPVRDSGCHLTMATRRTSSGVLRGRGQRQHEVLQATGHVPEELEDSVRKGFGPRFLDLLDQPKSPISHSALLLAHHLVTHAKKFRKPLPPQNQEGPEVIIDPQQSVQALLNLIEVKKEFLNDLRQINSKAREEATRVGAGDSPPRHFADATRALRRAVAWYQHLVTNNL
jgi:hypothetical protein